MRRRALTYANAKRSLLTYQDTQTGRRTDNLPTSATSTASGLTGLPAMPPVVAALPAGNDRTRQENGCA